jgi:excisionase family DNA binding protein
MPCYSHGMTYQTKAEAAAYMRVSQSTIDRWTREGRLNRYKIEGIRSSRYKTSELDELVVPDVEEDSKAGQELPSLAR